MVAVAGFFLWMMMNPAVAESIGLIGQKAKFAFGGQLVNWATFLTFIVEMAGMGGLTLCSIIVTFVFGREYTEGTAKNMLGLPIPRASFVAAKIIVSAVWFTLLTLWIIAETYLVGSILRLPGLTAELFLKAAARILVLALMSLCCSTLAAWVAVQTRGYFAPLGFTIGTLVLAIMFASTGWGPWVPWSIIVIACGAAGPGSELGWGSYAVIGVTFAIGVALVIRFSAPSGYSACNSFSDRSPISTWPSWWASPRMRKRSAPCRSHGLLSGIGRQTEHSEDALEIVAAIKFDLDAAAFLAVMNRDVGGEVLAEAILQVAQGGRADGFGASPTARSTQLPEPARDHPTLTRRASATSRSRRAAARPASTPPATTGARRRPTAVSASASPA
jgi:ABC-2 type transport system permease protein